MSESKKRAPIRKGWSSARYRLSVLALSVLALLMPPPRALQRRTHAETVNDDANVGHRRASSSIMMAFHAPSLETTASTKTGTSVAKR